MSEDKARIHANYPDAVMANLVKITGDFNDLHSIDLNKEGWEKGGVLPVAKALKLIKGK